MKPKFKKGDKIYFDGTYGRAIWRILDVLENSWSAPGPCYLAQMVEKGPKSWKKVRGAFIESVRIVDSDFKPLSEAPAEWVPLKDPMPSLMRRLRHSRLSAIWTEKVAKSSHYFAPATRGNSQGKGVEKGPQTNGVKHGQEEQGALGGRAGRRHSLA